MIVAINQFGTDSADEIAVVADFCQARGASFAANDGFARGGEGAIDLANRVIEAVDGKSTPPLAPLYPLDWPTERKIERIASAIYGASGVVFTPQAHSKIRQARKLGYGQFPVCMAKTQDSLSDNPKLRGRPANFTITVRDVEIAAGAEFLVALTGEIVRMPGLPATPAAERIDVNAEGDIENLT